MSSSMVPAHCDKSPQHFKHNTDLYSPLENTTALHSTSKTVQFYTDLLKKQQHNRHHIFNNKKQEQQMLR